MNKKLEDFIQNNKDDFDSYEPSEAMWQRIENRIENPEKKGLLVSMGARKWMSAAAAVIVIALAVFMFTKKEKAIEGGVAVTETPVNPAENIVKDTPQMAATAPEKPDTAILTTIEVDPPAMKASTSDQALKNIASEEMAHYVKLVELKQQQITILKKDEPLLYKQFAADFAKIDEEFNDLKKQKSVHPNSEQLLEAMIQNLKMQSALLNRQLEIVKSINNNKKKRYEKTYNSTI